jgi:hypothetical protein
LWGADAVKARSHGLEVSRLHCCSVDYCVGDDKGAAGPIVLLFPLWIAKDLYSNEGDEMSQKKVALCVEVFKGIMNCGMHLSKALVYLPSSNFAQIYEKGCKLSEANV